MCTVSICREERELLITMNRDELAGRAAEIAPSVHRLAGADWLGPIDGERAGTWIGVNEYGVAACLLNTYQSQSDLDSLVHPRERSRGEIIPYVLSEGPYTAACALAAQLDFTPYPSCGLLVASLDGMRLYSLPGCGQGDISLRELSGRWTLLTSSFWNTHAVEEWRHNCFDDWQHGEAHRFEGDLPAFHLWQPEGKAEWAPLMDRDYAYTRSITQVHISSRGIRMRYWSRSANTMPAREPSVTETIPLCPSAHVQAHES